MAKQKTLKVTVEGAFRFPIDMLRYDRLTPFTSADSLAIERTITGSPRNRLTVALVGAQCSPERWNSFGWSVVKTEEIR